MGAQDEHNYTAVGYNEVELVMECNSQRSASFPCSECYTIPLILDLTFCLLEVSFLNMNRDT